MSNDFSSKNYTRLNDELLILDRIDLENKFEAIVVDADQAYRYEGNFYGLLNHLNVPEDLFLQTLYVNRLTHPTEYKSNFRVLKIPTKPKIPKK